MALDYNQVNAITEKKWIPQMYDNIFDSGPILKRIKDKCEIKEDGGEKIMIPLNYALNNAGGWYSGSDTLLTTDTENISAAAFEWKQLYENITISGRDEMINNGTSAVLKFVKQKTMIAEKTMIDRMGDALYSAGTDPKSIIGLRVLVDNADSAGGISGSTYSWWQSQEDSSTTTVSLSGLLTQHTTLSINTDKPSVAATTRTLFNKYWGLLQPQQRYVDSKSANAGFDNVMFQGVPVFADAKCPANHWFFLNEKYLHYVVHSKRDMKFDGFKEPINQDVSSAKIYWMGAFCVSNRRMHGKFTALTA